MGAPTLQPPAKTNGGALTDEDRRLLRALHEDLDPATFVERVHAYYLDADRADRTPRAWMYFHLGQCLGVVMKLLAEKDHGQSRA